MVDGHIGCHVSWSPLRKWSMVFSLSPVLRVDEYVLEFFVVDGHVGCHVSWSPLWKWSMVFSLSPVLRVDECV